MPESSAKTPSSVAKIPRATLTALLNNKAQLTRVLTSHVVTGGRMDDGLSRLKSIKTVEGSSVMISMVGKNMMIDKAKVIKTDIRASNGIIRVPLNSVTPEKAPGVPPYRKTRTFPAPVGRIDSEHRTKSIGIRIIQITDTVLMPGM